MSNFHIGRSLSHDGLTIEDGQLIIHQKGFKGDIFVRPRDVTEIRASRSMYDIPFLQGTLNLRVGGKKYVLRGLPKGQRDAALRALGKLVASS
jgi:hypothetical protein